MLTIEIYLSCAAADQIERKCRMREMKQREEKRKLQKMQDEENKRMGICECAFRCKATTSAPIVISVDCNNVLLVMYSSCNEGNCFEHASLSLCE